MFCAAIAVAGGYSCAHSQTLRGTDDQTALGVPRIALSGSPGVALPQPLSPGEAARIRRIFALQAAGAIPEAIRETDLLENRLLLGPILADRYLGGWAHPGAADLADWLAKYGEQPDAPAIRALRSRMVPDDARWCLALAAGRRGSPRVGARDPASVPSAAETTSTCRYGFLQRSGQWMNWGESRRLFVRTDKNDPAAGGRQFE